MALVVVVAGLVGIHLLYNAAFQQQRERLIETAINHGRLIEAMARFGELHSGGSYPGGVEQATLSQILDAYEATDGHGRTGELVLAKAVSGKVIFLLSGGESEVNPLPLSFDSDLAEPIRRALSGEAGTLVGKDYRGVTVLAAYQPVHQLNWGIVAKVDLAEIRSPFFRAGMFAAAVAFVAILFGAGQFLRVTNPLLLRLIQSETKTRAVVETAVDGIITVDSHGLVQSFNAAAERLFGHTADEVIGQNVRLLMPLPHRDAHNDYIQRYLETGIKTVIGVRREETGLRKDGTVFPINLSVSEFVLGKQRMFTGIVTDITERKEAEKALFESQRSLATLMSNLPGMVYRCHNDEDWSMAFVSEGCVDLTGYQPEQLTSTDDIPYSKIIHPDDINWVREDVSKAITAHEPFRVVYRIRTAQDEQKWVWEQGQGVFSSRGVLLGLEGFITDVTERVQAENAVKEGAARIRAIVETAMDAIVTINERGIMESVNGACERMFGYSAEEAIGKNVSLLMQPHYGEHHNSFIDSYLATGEKKIIGIGREAIGMRKGGKTFPIRLSVSEFFVEEKRMFTGLIQDTTEEKSLQQRILQSERLAVVGRMAAKVAHEVRNPLSSISLNAEMLQEEISNTQVDNPEEAHALLTSMIDEIDRVTSLTDEYLQFSRLPDSKPVPGNLNGLIHEIVEWLRPELEEKRISLQCNGVREHLSVAFDHAQIRRVILNLVRNAIEAMPKGGTLRVATEKTEKKGVIAIQDTGAGIPEDLVDDIFSPFFTTKDLGTGLGLALSQQIVLEHSGQISCKSKVGEGTLFTIELPLEER